MADEGRGRRQVGRKGGAQAKSALAELAELRKSGAKRADRFEIKEEDAVYDMVDEAQYAQLVQKRREEGGGFVIDEEGLGYDDIGEEFDWGKADEENTEGNEPKQGGGKAAPHKGAAGGAKRKATEQPVPGARAKMAQMFQAAALKARPAKPLDDAAANAALDDVLANLDAASKPAAAGFARKPTALHRPAQPAARPAPGRRPAVAAAALVTPRPAAHSAAKPVARPSAYTAGLARPAPALLQHAAEQQDLMDEDQAMPDLPDFAGDDDHDWGNQGADAAAQQGGQDGGAAESGEADGPQVKAEERTPAGHGSQQHEQEAPDTEGPSSRGAAGAAAAKTPWKTPAPVFADPKTPGTAAPASGWQLLYDGAGEPDEAARGVQNGATEAVTPSGAAGATEPAAEVEQQQEWRDDGTLPVDKDGVLHFYLVDAHEELAQPGTVFLFGKVSQEGHHMSCCAVVRGMQRNLFVVPREEVASDEISRLEAAAATDLEARKKLIPLLHQAFSGVKAEVRQLLSKHQVTQMTLKPVKREYAFEDLNVRHGKQWVLKVKYPATQPSLPLGLSGQTFSAVFGANQSSLEALVLKRRVMGPGWLALKHPRRVDSQAQVSWCKLEVEVDSHKAIMAGGSDGNNRWEAPPLTMASLSLKTTINPQTAANEVVAASVVYLTKVKTDGPMSQEEWNNPRELRHFSCIRKLDSQTFPMGFDGEVRQANQSELGKRNGGNMLAVQANERALLAYLLARLRAVDIDVFVGHNFAAFDLDVLLHRLQHHRVPHWSSLGRLKRSKFPSLGGGGHTFGGGAGTGALSVVAGRLLCDTYLAARELVREVDYTLSTLARNLLKQERAELAAADVPGKYESAAKLVQLVRHAESDAWLAMGLAFFLSVLPLTKQLAALSGSLWSKALLGQRAQRIEMLLLHEFHDKKFLLPDKLSIKDKDRLAKLSAAGEEVEGGAAEGAEAKPAGKKSKGPQYAGGLVLEPKKGLYDRFVLLLDFNSLYPSIIQEYNICFTTVARPKDGSIPPLPEPSEEMAVLPRVIRALVQRRRTVKDLIKSERDPVRRQQLEIRQQALKLTANSMYGCLGFGNSRFYAKPLAELITAQGREILQSTVDLVQANLGKEVIYGDTDSIMVYTGSDNLGEVVKLGQAIKKEVNKRYRLLEIEMDGVFKCMLLLKKKKYAAVKIELAPDGRQLEVMEQKGLDIVRRDWCPLSKDVGNFALKEILSGRLREEVVDAIHSHLEDVKGKVLGDAVPLNKYVITKQLTKRPEDYPDAKAQPHVQVALRRREAGKRDGVLPGETVPYVICIEVGEDGQPLPREAKGLAERAYHPEEVKSNPALRVDTEYYLAQQVFPVVSRLCAPISGTDPARLADCLGLDGSRYRQPAAGGSDARDDMLLAGVASLDDEDRYKDCDPLLLTGSNGTQFRFPGVRELLKPNSSIAVEAALLPPDGVGEAVDGSRVEPLSPAQVANQLQLRMRECISRYYEGRLQSDDEVLPCATRNICLRVQPDGRPGTAPPDPKCSGHMHAVYSEAALYTQLSYYHRLFDTASLAHTLSREALQAAEDKLAPIAPVLRRAAAAAAKLRDRSGYKWVDLGSLYGRLALAPQQIEQ